MSKGPLELAWDDNRHNALLARLYKQLHCDPNHVPMSAMDCLAAAMLTLSRGTRQFTQEAVLNYVEKYIMQRDDGLAHVQGGKRFEPAMLITLNTNYYASYRHQRKRNSRQGPFTRL